jgi:hypothetical protein
VDAASLNAMCGGAPCISSHHRRGSIDRLASGASHRPTTFLASRVSESRIFRLGQARFELVGGVNQEAASRPVAPLRRRRGGPGDPHGFASHGSFRGHPVARRAAQEPRRVQGSLREASGRPWTRREPRAGQRLAGGAGGWVAVLVGWSIAVRDLAGVDECRARLILVAEPLLLGACCIA